MSITNYILADVHLVLTEIKTEFIDREQLMLANAHRLYTWCIGENTTYATPHHLYFTDNSEIKEGDWILNPLRGDWEIITKADEKFLRGNGEHGAKKIIATTNKELWETETLIDGATLGKAHAGRRYKGTISLASIPISFIKTYIKSYNDGSIIKQVKLEIALALNYSKEEHLEKKLKLNSDGSVIILPEEEKIYTREEMFEAIKAWEHWYHLEATSASIKDWFDKNYPI